MKKVNSFTITKTPKGYSVFIYWEHSYNFTNLKTAEKFVASADNFLFTEFFKMNELYQELLPYISKSLFISTPDEKITIFRLLEEINDMIKYIHLPKSSPNINVWVINKIKQSYLNLIQLNELFFLKSKSTSDTINVYKSKTLAEKLNSSYSDFISFKYLTTQKPEITDTKIVNLEPYYSQAI